eukprot:m.63858 g.63858  ORF g.63858 m.63858 type:complete len:109 (-) comp17815_c0_seq4:3982-4308(-)
MAQADEVDEERLKSAVGYTVGLIVKDFEEKSEGPTFSKRTISLLGDLVYRQTETAAVDLQLFARHAKRTTVTMEDVKLISRRSDTIVRLPTSNPTSIPLVMSLLFFSR